MSGNTEVVAPDLIEPIVCFRRLEVDSRHAYVTSPYRRSVRWDPRKGQGRAACHRPLSSPHEPEETPAEECTCGFYAHASLEQAEETLMSMTSATKPDGTRGCEWTEFVVVALAWGKVVLHDRGLRAEKMAVAAVHDGPYNPRLKRKIGDFARFSGVPYLGREDLALYAEKLGHGQNLYNPSYPS